MTAISEVFAQSFLDHPNCKMCTDYLFYYNMYDNKTIHPLGVYVEGRRSCYIILGNFRFVR